MSNYCKVRKQKLKQIQTNHKKKKEKDGMQKGDEDLCNANPKAYRMSPLTFTNLHI
jgi:hypothetical protein